MYAVFQEIVERPPAFKKEEDVSSCATDKEDEPAISVKSSVETMDVTENKIANCEEKQSENPYYVPCGSTYSDVRKKSRFKLNSLDQPSCVSLYMKHLREGTTPDCEISANPLLDTINVLTYDNCDDSDDYYEMDNDSRDSSPAKIQQKTDGHQTEGDRESIGYAGSNSIDSGYKSFCPTPEMPDPSAYSPNNFSKTGKPQTFSCTRSNSIDKTKVNKVTKAVSRQESTSSRSSSSRRSDQNLYEVNLDHLMYLRQSLLSAIQQCESANCEEKDTESPSKMRRRLNAGHRKIRPVLSADSATYTSSIYQKTVRFNTDLEMSSNATLKKECDSHTLPRKKDKELSYSKSILKDPLCENLRTKLKSESSDSTLEEEIDSLLYGRAEFYDLESVDDFPCSYVTMIEEKYKTAKPSIAKVRKLRGVKVQDRNKAPNTTDNERVNTDSPPKDIPKDMNHRCLDSAARYRFTEVARCMIEIIEDLQIKKLQADPSISKQTDQAKDTYSTKGEEASCYASASDYHVYEEIAYDLIGGKKLDRPWTSKDEVPPPLPARPSSLLLQDRHGSEEESANQKGRRGRSLMRPRGESSVRNRPKQRSNLYSLFADQTERRNISRSLERESRTGSYGQEDEYGFRKSFTSI